MKRSRLNGGLGPGQGGDDGHILQRTDTPSRRVTATSALTAADGLTELLIRVAEQDERALSSLYDATIARVFALARRVAGNEADAEEVVCDVYSQVWDTAPSYDTKRGTVMAWLMMLCRSRALDLLRRNASRQEAHRRHAEQATAGGLSHWDPVDDVRANTRLHEALSKLPAERRQVVGLAYFRGLSHEEIATTAALPLGTVKSHVRRGLLTLREHFER